MKHYLKKSNETLFKVLFLSILNYLVAFFVVVDLTVVLMAD